MWYNSPEIRTPGCERNGADVLSVGFHLPKFLFLCLREMAGIYALGLKHRRRY